MASIAGLGKIGLPRLSENMDPEDARAENFSEELRGRLSGSLGKEEI